ncbi:multidrug ABC transporter ATP-binding protein [Deltaproteobacteria bacterium]|nr:multidrug ABC transporter ATP-binding protein [Deltaproteobacteria bacterium]
MGVIVAENVVKRFGRTVALAGVSLRVRAGERVALLGHNGAGKSTLMKMLAGQLLPGEGRILLAGVDVAAEPNRAREGLGYVPEEPAMWDYLSARECLEFVVGVRGRGDVDAALALTGLGADAERLVREYSQGMRRKVAIAAALVSEPPVLVLDEALNGLDPPSALVVVDELNRRARAGVAVLLSTHVIDLVPRVADRVVVLRAGKVELDVAVAELGADGLSRVFRAAQSA